MTQQLQVLGGQWKRAAMGLVWGIVIFAVLQLARGTVGHADEADVKKSEARAASERAEFFPRPTPGEQEFLAALETAPRAELEFVEEPLQDVVNDLRDLFHLEIVLDDKALGEAGIAADTPISLPRLKKASLKSRLDMIAAKYGIYYLIGDDVMTLTSQEVVCNADNLLTRVYPVADLAPEGDYDTLAGIITDAVDRDFWKDAGGRATIGSLEAAHSLVITQTRGAHGKILQLLRAMRAARDAS